MESNLYNNLHFDTTYDLCPNNTILKQILLKLDNYNDDLISKQSIDQTILIYLETESEESRNVLIYFFTRFNSKKHTRKYLFECLTKRELNLTHKIIKESVQDHLHCIENGNFKTKYCIDLMNFLYVYLQIYRGDQQFEFIIDQVFPLYCIIIQIFVGHLKHDDDLYGLVHYTLQHQLIVLAKNSSKLKQYSVEFIRVCEHILGNSEVKFDLKSKCGLALAYYLNNLDDDQKTYIVNKEYPIVDILQAIFQNQEICLKLSSCQLPNVFSDDKLKVVVYSATLSTVKSKWLKTQVFITENLIVYIYKHLIDYGKQFTGYPEQIILISRSLCLIIEKLDQYDIFKQIFQISLNFIWSHLEHFVESVCHHTRIYFKNLVSLTIYFASSGHTEFKTILLDNIKTLSLYSTTRLVALKIISEYHESFLLEIDDLQRYLLNVLGDENLAPQASDIYMKLMERQANFDDEEFLHIWIKPILKISRKIVEDNSVVYQNIITHGFKERPAIFQDLFHPDRVSSNVENAAFLKCAQYARKNGLVFIDHDCPEFWRQLIPKKKLKLFMLDQNEEVRILTLETIVETQKTTEEVLEWEFGFLIEYFCNNVATQMPSIRKKIAGFYKKFFNRCEVGYTTLLKKRQEQQHEDEINKNKIEHFEKFFNDFAAVTISFLSIESNHPRRSLSLELLLRLEKIICKDQWVELFSMDDINNLKNILFDSYEMNKAMAVELLSTFPVNLIGFNKEDDTLDYFKMCLALVSDIKPSKSLSGTYMFQVCLLSKYPKKVQELSNNSSYKDFRYDIIIILTGHLEGMFMENRYNILKAAQSNSLHGIFLSIRNLLSGRNLKKHNNLYAPLFKQLTLLSLIIKDSIMTIVCNPSPEGNIPEDCNVDETSTAQLILVYAWRTMKEMMLLLSTIVQQTVTLQEQHTMLEVNELKAIGQFFLDIFIQAKHRGVFEQAHVAFSLICEEFWRSNNVEIKTLPLIWLNTSMSLCTGKQLDDRLCSTRRSAGLPFLILGIISTEPLHANFQKTVTHLLSIAKIEDNTTEFRMHSMNVLRFIFINSKVGDLVSGFIDEAVIAALQGFRSTIWGIRNSATLLFSALMTRMFGVQRSTDTEILSSKNRLTVATFYLRYPKLLNFLLQVLSEESNNPQSQILHPVLLILARLYPSRNEKIRDQLEESTHYINVCISNPVIRTRYLAARASLSLISLENQHFIDYFLNINDRNIEENSYHGVLLQIWNLLHSQHSEQFSLRFLKHSSEDLKWLLKKCSHQTLSLHFSIVTKLLMRNKIPADYLDVLKTIVRALVEIEPNQRLSTSHSYKWNKLLLLFQIIINNFQWTDTTDKVIKKELIECLYNEDVTLTINCMKFLIYLNANSRVQYEEHPLFFCENLEISLETRNLIESFHSTIKQKLLKIVEEILPYFFWGNLKRNCHNSVTIYLFLLLRHYPNIISIIYKDHEQQFLDLFLKYQNNEELSSAILSCVSNFLLQNQGKLCFNQFFERLMEAASPAASDFSRLTAAQVVVNLRPLYWDQTIFNDDQYFILMNIIMVLLEDEELLIRNYVARIVGNTKSGWRCIPSKVREEILSKNWLLEDTKIQFLWGWIGRCRSVVSTDVSEIYERGDLNQFSENIPIISAGIQVLTNMLFENQTVSQQLCVEITQKLVRCSKKDIPMMREEIQSQIRTILKNIEQLVSGWSEIEFKLNFGTIINREIVENFKLTMGVKQFLYSVYKPFY